MFDIGQMFTPSKHVEDSPETKRQAELDRYNTANPKKPKKKPEAVQSGVGKAKTPTLYGGKRTKDEADTAKKTLLGG